MGSRRPQGEALLSNLGMVNDNRMTDCLWMSSPVIVLMSENAGVPAMAKPK